MYDIHWDLTASGGDSFQLEVVDIASYWPAFYVQHGVSSVHPYLR